MASLIENYDQIKLNDNYSMFITRIILANKNAMIKAYKQDLFECKYLKEYILGYYLNVEIHENITNILIQIIYNNFIFEKEDRIVFKNLQKVYVEILEYMCIN